MTSENLSHDRIARFFGDGILPPVFLFDTTDSTNRRASEFAAAVIANDADAAEKAVAGAIVSENDLHRARSDISVFVAEEQTAGRGRLGRTFYSPRGKGLYITFLLMGDAVSGDGTELTTRAAVAVSDAVSDVCGLTPEIKWVNDLWLGRKKLAGILAQGRQRTDGGFDYAVLGIGINVGVSALPDELRSVVTRLDEHTGSKTDRNRLAAAVIRRIINTGYADRHALMDVYRARCPLIGKNVSVIRANETVSAFVCTVEDDGGIRLALPSGEVTTLRSGEVSIRAEDFPAPVLFPEKQDL